MSKFEFSGPAPELYSAPVAQPKRRRGHGNIEFCLRLNKDILKRARHAAVDQGVSVNKAIEAWIVMGLND
jgi:predicted HicB family RNase H-like nuclease